MDPTPQRIAVIGCGTMGEAIVSGLLRNDGAGRPAWLGELTVTARDADRRTRLAQAHGVVASHDNVAAARDAELVILCLKPRGVLELIDDAAFAQAVTDKVVVSIAAGVSLSRLTSALPGAKPIRAMPNTPCTIGRGTTVLARSGAVSDTEIELARAVFESVGAVIELADEHMDAVTSLNGSGPAFVYVLLESMADGGVMMGLPRDVAIEMAARVFEGAAAMVVEKDVHPAALKDQVTTPAGCTIAGLLNMEDGRIRSVLARTVQEAARVAASLGREAKD